jgi:arabinofuranosyltransferase
MSTSSSIPVPAPEGVRVKPAPCTESMDRLVIAVGSMVLLGMWLPIIMLGRSAVIGGVRYWWLGDDAMISMRYAYNLARGHGLVWNRGERVEGYTNFLWTMWMWIIHLLPVPLSSTSLLILLTNVALSVGTIPILVRVARLLG